MIMHSGFHISCTSGIGLPRGNLANPDTVASEPLTEGIEDKTGDVFRGGVHVSEVFQLIQKPMIQFLNDFLRGLLQLSKVNEDAVFSHLFTGDKHLYLPIVTMQVFARAMEIPQLVCGSQMGDDSQFVHGLCRLAVFIRLRVPFLVNPAAFTALSVDDDTRAGAVRAQDAIVQIESLLVVGSFFLFVFKCRTTMHTEAAFFRHGRAAVGASLTRDLSFAMGAFHHGNQLFLEVCT